MAPPSSGDSHETSPAVGSLPRTKIRARGFPDGPQPTPDAPCSLCEWDGDLGWFFGRPNWKEFDEEAERRQIWTPKLGCAFCALRLRIAEMVAPERGSTDMAIGHGTKDGHVFMNPIKGSVDVPITMYKLFIREDATILETHEAEMKPVKRRLTIGNSTASQKSFDFIQKQLDECRKNHSSTCGIPNATFCPTRLVDVTPINDAGDVSLFVSPYIIMPGQARTRPYAALSYCWGRTVPECRLLSSTLEALKGRIAWDSMPKTLQDAVVCTRRLGLQYLWIDAVCIIQDSDADWAKEAALMSDVYQNSFVTLAGLHSSESTQGLFREGGKESSVFRLLDLQVDDQVYTIYMFNSHAHPDLDISDDASLNPLLRRGWCFQERVLAPRVVFFGAEELLWECNTLSSCQCLELGHRRAQRPPLKQRLAVQLQDDSSANLNSISKGQMDDWRSIVSAYTNTQLSKFKDRLIAINGLAKLFFHTRKKKEGDQYLAGLWSSSIVQDLAWSARSLSWPLDLDPSPSKPAEALDDRFVAPTWSWASVPGHVTWWNGMGEVDDFIFEPTASATHSRVTYLHNDPFGLSLEGHLELSGHLIPCVVSRIRWQSCDLEVLGCRLLVDLDLDERPRGHWEGLVEREESKSRPNEKLWRFRHVFLIPLGRRGPSDLTERGLESDDIGAILCHPVNETADHINRGFRVKRLGLVTITMEHNEVPEPLQFIFSEDGRQPIVLL